MYHLAGCLAVPVRDFHLHREKPGEAFPQAIIALVGGKPQGGQGDLPGGARGCQLSAFVGVLKQSIQQGPVGGLQLVRTRDLDQLSGLREAV